MKKFILSFLALTIIFIFSYKPSPADTFSIAAIDPATMQVGSAGASCYNTYPGCIILSDVHPGVGVVHTQASWIQQNQDTARKLMNMGYSPQQIIDYMIAHDYQGNPLPRQYGVIDFINGGRSAAYSGSGCTDWKGHLTGSTYSIQGNILLGSKVIDSMKARFLGTTGILAVRLMAALQGAKMVGADTRCAVNGTSSSSAFIRVAKSTDPQSGPYWLDISVRMANPIPYGKDPIDSLQHMFDVWLTTVGLTGFSNNVPEEFMLYQNYPNPFNPLTTIKFDLAKSSNVKLALYDIIGNEVAVLVDNLLFPAGVFEYSFDAGNLASGTYIYKLTSENYSDSKKMTLVK